MRTGNDAIAWARDHMTWPEGFCLQWVRSCFDVDALYADAATAWLEANFRHPTDSGAHCPRGVPVYWTGGSEGHGHIALAVGDGHCLSTDAAGAGRVAKVRINDLTARWGLDFRGWAEDVNQIRVYNPQAGKPAAGWERVRISALGPGKNNRDVEVVERRLTAKLGNQIDPPIVVDGLWGDRVTNAYKLWQRRLGFNGTAADGLPGRFSLERLDLQVVD